MSLGNTSSAVREQRAPSRVSSDDAAQALWRELDFFPTPPWAARAIAHRIKDVDPLAVTISDPACGMGHMAEPFGEVFGELNVYASDVYDYGYGDVGDFLERLASARSCSADWIVTNPPFAKAAEFITQGLCLARRGVAVLCRLAFLESVDRYSLLFDAPNPMTALMPFAERVPMQLGSWDPKLSTATAYALFVFMKGAQPLPPRGFAPGTRNRFWHHDDPSRFAKPAPIPLFEKVASAPLFR